MELFDNIWKLVGVPVITVQLRYNGWVTELSDSNGLQQPQAHSSGAAQPSSAKGVDNLLYSADADFSCFADLALTSPDDYYREGEGSLMQCVLTPADPYLPLPNEQIAQKVDEQVRCTVAPRIVVRQPASHSCRQDVPVHAVCTSEPVQ